MASIIEIAIQNRPMRPSRPYSTTDSKVRTKTTQIVAVIGLIFILVIIGPRDIGSSR